MRLRKPLERAAADRGLSVADFVEAAVLRAMGSAGVILIAASTIQSGIESNCGD